jgi:hypothetical protein
MDLAKVTLDPVNLANMSRPLPHPIPRRPLRRRTQCIPLVRSPHQQQPVPFLMGRLEDDVGDAEVAGGASADGV